MTLLSACIPLIHRVSACCGLALVFFQITVPPAFANPMAVPTVGSHEFRILSPTVLELTLVTTKDPDPAPVTTWNFVGPNFTPNLPATTEFQVSADASPIQVAQVGFRRRPIYAPLKTRDLRIGNSLFLQLATPLANGQTVMVRNPSGQLWTAPMNFSAQV